MPGPTEDRAPTLIDPRCARFLSALTHELRTPLGSVLMLSEMMARSETDAQAGRARTMHQAALDMRHVLDQVGRLARIESGRVACHRATVDTEALADQVADDVLHLGEPTHAPEFHRVAPLPTSVDTDIDLAREVVRCLVGQATPNADRHLQVIVRPEADDGLAIEVLHPDTVLDMDQLDAIFEPFAAVSQQLGRRHGGTSLDLTIARALGQRIGARVEARNQADHRLALRLILPVATSTTS